MKEPKDSKVGLNIDEYIYELTSNKVVYNPFEPNKGTDVKVNSDSSKTNKDD